MDGITNKDIASEWKDISVEAFRRAEKTDDIFRNKLILVGAATTAISGILLFAKPDLIGLAISTITPLLGTTLAHISAYKEEHFYRAFAKHALDERRNHLKSENQAHGDFPRIDEEEFIFRNSVSYNAPSTLSSLNDFRMAVIGMTAGTALTVVGCFSEGGLNLLNNGRNEDYETNQPSEFAPETSMRPVARPSFQ